MTEQQSDNGRQAATADTQAEASPTPVSAEELLAERRRWFGSFPEGPLDLVAAVRIVWILALFVIPAVVGGFLRTYAVFGTSLLLLADCGLTMWWLTRLRIDCDRWLGTDSVAHARVRRAGLRPTAATVAAHALLFAFALSFMTLPLESARLHPEIVATVRWVLFAAYLAAIPVAVVMCRTAGLRGRWSVLLLPVPLLHWWTVRRFAADAGTKLAGQVARQSNKSLDFSRAGFIFADVTWAIFILVLIVNLVTGGGWTQVTFQGLCSGLIVGVAAIADVAAMESAQHVYLMYLRTAPPRARS